MTLENVMPQNIDFRFPVPCRLSPDVDRARAHNLQWVHTQQLATGRQAIERYVSWDMAKLAAYMYPYATGDDLDLAADLMGFWFPFDDQFDGPLGRDPQQTAQVCRAMIHVVHHPQDVTATDLPAVRAFADMWQRSMDGMSPAWRARAAHNWEYYFACYPGEALARLSASVPSRNDYLHLRRGSSGGQTVVDMCERLGHFEVPAVAFHSPPLRTMRRIATDVPAFCNDIHSVEKEAARGDVNNLVLIVQHEQQLAMPEALRTVRDLVNQQLDAFGRLQQQIPQLTRAMGLAADERTAVDRYAETMALWMPGYHQWGVETARYSAQGVTPARTPAYPEDLCQGFT
jgi:hypothetical protein